MRALHFVSTSVDRHSVSTVANRHGQEPILNPNGEVAFGTIGRGGKRLRFVCALRSGVTPVHLVNRPEKRRPHLKKEPQTLALVPDICEYSHKNNTQDGTIVG